MVLEIHLYLLLMAVDEIGSSSIEDSGDKEYHYSIVSYRARMLSLRQKVARQVVEYKHNVSFLS